MNVLQTCVHPVRQSPLFQTPHKNTACPNTIQKMNVIITSALSEILSLSHLVPSVAYLHALS